MTGRVRWGGGAGGEHRRRIRVLVASAVVAISVAPIAGAPSALAQVGQSELISVSPAGLEMSPQAFAFDTSADGERVVVTVSDTGIGIPASEQANLFQRFFRASNATHKAIPGTGLGLAIARSIVAGHGGDLELESVEGRGTTIRVRLPLAGAVPAGNAGHLGTV